MDPVKKAFQKVREDIDTLKLELKNIKENLIQVCEIIKELSKSNEINIPTHQHINSTSQTNSSTHDINFKVLKPQNLGISIGNRGASTDKQTDKQTDQHIQKSSYNQENNNIDNAAEVLDSLDNIKKELRLKFKKLTEQELRVFSTLYTLSEENHFTNYKEMADKLRLSESSIRDYVGRLIKKQIPVDKIKINNKNIQLSISKNLRKITTLSTILQLREL